MELLAERLEDAEKIPALLAEIRAAIDDHPSDVQAHHNLAQTLLSIGHFEEGWGEYRWRLELPEVRFKAQYGMFPVKRWDGTDPAGKCVLVWLDQGLGDQIMQATILPDLIAEAEHVTVLAHYRLTPLLQRALPGATVARVTDDISWDAFDCQMSVHDLGARYRKSFDDFPKRTLLKADPLPRYSPGLTVGVSWSSANPHHNGKKTIPIEKFRSLFSVDGVTFIDLQYGEVELPPGLGRDSSVDPLVDMDRFASQVAACDIVISASNTTLHVAGALGKRTIGLVPHGKWRHWYWFTGRDDSPWYPKVRILRQAPDGSWDAVLDAVKQWLELERDEFVPAQEMVSLTQADDASELAKAKARIAELERAIEPLLGFADCDDFSTSSIVRPRGNESLESQRKRLTDITRKVVYTDIYNFRALKRLMARRWT